MQYVELQRTVGCSKPFIKDSYPANQKLKEKVK